MPTPEQWLEAEKRGLLTPEKKAILDEARKRGIMPVNNAAPDKGHVPRLTPHQGRLIDIDAPENAEIKASLETESARQKKEKESRLSNRGIMERTGDTAAFVGSVIPRALTRGQYGLGDILPGKMGENVARAERDFVEANEPGLQLAADIGSVTAGVPGGQTMGAPLRGLNATAKTILASPRATVREALRGAGEALEGASRQPGAVAGEAGLRLPTALNRAGKGLQNYADGIQAKQPRQTPVNAKAQSANVPQNIQTIPERLADMQAFRDLGMKPFAPSLGSSGTARVGRTIEELPIVGGTVKSPKTDIELALAKTQADIGKELGSKGSEEAAGTMLQRALERYQGAGIDDLEPNTLRQKGVDPYQPVKASETMSAPAAARAADPEIAAARVAGGGGRAQTSRGVDTPSARSFNQIGLRRTNAEDLSDTELAKYIREPSNQTSFASRAEALYESADRKIPALKKSDGTANPNQVATVNLGNAIKQTMGEVGSQISGQNTLRGRLADQLANGFSNFTYGKLSGIRTEIGRALGQFGQFDVGLDRSQLKRLYAAATQDKELALRDIASRAWRDHRAGQTLADGTPNKAYIPASEARKADRALYEFRRADRYFRQGMERIDKFMNVMGAKTPNEAARKIVTALKEKTANPQMLREIKGVLRPEELNALRGHVIENLGRGRAGANMAEAGFNVNHWATDFTAIMSHPAGREFMKGLPEGVGQKLQNMARVVNRMKYYEATKNHSGSAYTGIGILPLLSGDLMTAGTGAAVLFGGGGLGGKLLTSNAFLSFQENLMRAQLKAGNTAASNAKILAQHLKRLPAIAKNVKDLDEQKAITAVGIAAQQYLEQQRAQALPAP